MKHTLLRTTLAAVALAIPHTLLLAADTLYRVTDLGVLGCGGYCSSIATDINNIGQIVGRSTTSGGSHATLWNTDGRVLDLGTTYGASSTSAQSINNLGQVVGYSGNKAFYWDTHVGMWELNLAPAGGLTYVAAINDQGVVTGFTADSLGYSSGFRWRAGFPAQSLPAFGRLDGTASSRASSINAAGDIAGYASTIKGLTGLVWQANGTMQALDFFPSSINDLGHMVGVDADSNAVYFDGAHMRRIASPSGGLCSLTDLNNANVLLGTCSGRAAVGSASGLAWLDTLIDPTDPLKGVFTIKQASAINDRGQVVGYGRFGTKDHAFLLTPVPEPGTFTLLLAGLAALACVARRRGAAAMSAAARSPAARL